MMKKQKVSNKYPFCEIILIKGQNSLCDFLKKTTYFEDHNDEIKEIFLATNEEHRHILELFKAKDKDSLFKYLAETHWRGTYASYDLLI